MKSKNKVPLPESGIIVRRSGEYRYVYKILKTFRTDKGKPTNIRKAIGKLDDETGMLIPNATYWELYESNHDTLDMSLSYKSVRSIGATFLISRILEGLGVSAILSEVFGTNRAATIISSAIYMSCRGNIFELATHCCEEFTFEEAPLTSQGTSRLFSSITFDEKMNFFKLWVLRCRYSSYLAYDVTSFSTYANGIENAEYGYNRDKEKLPQINFGCYLAQDTGIPLFYVIYPGSIVDKAHMTYMMAYNETLGISDVVFVMDRGFCMATNIRYMRSEKLAFICGADISHKTTSSAVSKVKETIISMKNVTFQGVYASSVKSEFYGITSTLHIYFDPLTAERQRQDLYRTVEHEDEKLAKSLQLSKREIKSYLKHFDIEELDDGTFKHARNYTKIDNEANNCGYFALLTNTDIYSEEALSIYRRKDSIEKGFDELKNHIDMKRLRSHNTNTTDGKMFCAFISLIAVSELNRRLSVFMKDNYFTKNSLIAELEKIKIVTLTNGIQLMNPVTKTQRTIFEACTLGEDDLSRYIQRS